MSRLLILPSGNTFTHVLECQSIGCEIEALGHEVFYGISKHYAFWAKKQNLRYYIISELWERGPTDYPNISWFIDHNYVAKCVHEEINLIKHIQPDYVLANFKYTSRLSTRAVNTPLITINILSMLSETKSNFGYLPGDTSPESLQQQNQLAFFDKFACSALSNAARRIGLKPLPNLSDYLDGNWVLIPDSPFFHKIKISSLPKHYLPINFLHRKKMPPELQALQIWLDKTYRQNPSHTVFSDHLLHTFQQKNSHKKSLFLALGSICRSQELLVYLISALACDSWQLHVSTSGTNTQFIDQLKRDFPNVIFANFFDIQQLAQRGLDLYICHGGLGSIYDGLQHAIPTLIIPQQPEQDHNGMLAEQLGIGTRLWPSHPFCGENDRYKKKLFETSEMSIRETVKRILDDQTFKHRINKAKTELLSEVLTFPSPADILQKIINNGTLCPFANSDSIGGSQPI